MDKIKELPDNSVDVEPDNIIKRYERRPKKLENLCLADFVRFFEKCFAYCIKYFVKEIFDFHGKYTIQKLKPYRSKCQSLKIRVAIILSILSQTSRQC